MKERFSHFRELCSDLLYRLGIGRYSYSHGLSRRLVWQYFLSLAITLAVIGALEVLCAIFFTNTNEWRALPLVSDVIYLAGYNPLWAFLLSGALSWFVCTVFFLRWPLKYLDELVYAAGDLARYPDRPIFLPEALRDAEEIYLAEDQKT